MLPDLRQYTDTVVSFERELGQVTLVVVTAVAGEIRGLAEQNLEHPAPHSVLRSTNLARALICSLVERIAVSVYR